ncbi:hypothetical protein DL770_003877 [Monosporascus sp. CRB-9-2]|nr:hypothetical protein DL770_003877 [Monosporascus sp. CRB-9-2]
MRDPLDGFGSLLQRRQENSGIIFTEPRDSANGSFIFPRTWPISFRETSTINITWTTNYEGINLYYYQRGKVATSIQIATTEWYFWEVRTEEANVTEPFVFRIVNAHGTNDEQLNGGFWSTSFFIRRDTPADTVTSASTSISSTSNSATPTHTASSVDFSSSLTASSPTSTTSSTSSSLPPGAEEFVQGADSSLSPGAIAAVVVGAVLGAAIVAAVGFWYGRRKIRNVRPPAGPAELTAPPSLPPQWKSPEPPAPPVELYTRPPELHGDRVYYEMPSNHN